MASISSSPSRLSGFRLLLRNVKTEEEGTYSLYSACHLQATLCLSEGLPVIESACYALGLVSDSAVDVDELFVSVNGGDPFLVSVEGWTSVAEDGSGQGPFYTDLKRVGSSSETKMRPLFMLTYGFARIQLEMICDSEEICLSTKDIVTLGEDSFQDDLVEQMLNDLLNPVSTVQNQVIRWMFTGRVGRPKPYSSVEASMGKGETVSLLAYLQLLERIVSDYRKYRNYFRCHGYSKISKERERVSPGKVRQVWYRELSWISKNTGMLYKVPGETSIRYCGESYLAQYIETCKGVRKFESYENRLVIGFLKEVIKEAKRTLRMLKDMTDKASENLRSVSSVLNRGISGRAEYCASLRLISSYFDREQRFSSRLDGLISELEKEYRAYKQFFADVAPLFSRAPKRTKVFQEVEAYSVIYGLIEMWLHMGDYALDREEFVMQIYRLDELYEYYVLYRLLLYLYEQGFREDSLFFDPISHVSYTGGRGKSGINDNIANRYCLYRENQRVRLYYEPCIRGDEIEEHGVVLHRLSTNHAFSKKKKKHKDSCWTPDYLLEVHNSSGKKEFHVLDAKFRKPSDVYSGFPVGERCEFATCLFKYKYDVAGKEDDEFVTSVWLLCGRDDGEYYRRMEQSSWALANYRGTGSGVGVVTPYFSCLDELMHGLLTKDDQGRSKSSASVSEKNPDNDIAYQVDPTEGSALSSSRLNGYIFDLYRIYHDKASLFSAAWAQGNLGMSHPLLRKEAPRGREKKGYQLIDLDGKRCYAYTGMLPHCAERLARFVRRYRAELGLATKANA